MSKVLAFIKAKRVFFIIGFLVVGFFVARAVLLRNPTPLLTYTVKREDLVDTVQVSGTYKTASQIAVTSPARGILSAVYVVNNQQVKRGDPLFHVQSTATEDEKATAYADYASALSAEKSAEQNKIGLQAQLEKDRAAVISNSSAVDIADNKASAKQPNPATGSMYSQNDLDAIHSALTSSRETFNEDEKKYNEANVAINAAAAQLTAAQKTYRNTQDTTVSAPADGIVVNLLNKVGDQIAGSTQTQVSFNSTTQTQVLSAADTPVLLIADLENPYLTAEISEDYAARIMEGQKSSIVFDALKDRTFAGTVGTIDTVGTDKQGVVTYTARINVDGLSGLIKPNMTALITIETLRKNSVLDVPNSAIIFKDGKTYVQDAKTNKIIGVTIGTKGTAKTEITSGVSEGMVLVANTN